MGSMNPHVVTKAEKRTLKGLLCAINFYVLDLPHVISVLLSLNYSVACFIFMGSAGACTRSLLKFLKLQHLITHSCELSICIHFICMRKKHGSVTLQQNHRLPVYRSFEDLVASTQWAVPSFPAYFGSNYPRSPHVSPYLCVLPVRASAVGTGPDGRMVYPALEPGHFNASLRHS